MLPRSILTPGTPIPRRPPAGADGPGADRPSPQAFLRSAMPALDRAFGLEDEAAFPDDIADLVARLHAGPLGVPGEGPESERAASLELAEAAS